MTVKIEKEICLDLDEIYDHLSFDQRKQVIDYLIEDEEVDEIFRKFCNMDKDVFDVNVANIDYETLKKLQENLIYVMGRY